MSAPDIPPAVWAWACLQSLPIADIETMRRGTIEDRIAAQDIIDLELIARGIHILVVGDDDTDAAKTVLARVRKRWGLGGLRAIAESLMECCDDPARTDDDDDQGT